MSFMHYAFAALAPLTIAATALHAQGPRPAQRHEGFWIGFGFGGSKTNMKCTGCAFTGPSDPWRGGFGSGGYLAMGGALSQQLQLGGEVNSSQIIGNDRDATVAQVLFVMRYYPGAHEGLHLTAAFGPAAYVLAGRGGTVEATGFAGRVGAGFDFAVGRRFALVPYASIARTAVQQGSLSVSGTAGPVTKLENSIVSQFGLGFHWH